MNRIIDLPCYIVMDIPSPMAERVQDMRKKFDAERAAMPAEVTLTGSCGVGTITSGQYVDEVIRLMDETAGKYKAFDTAFDKVERFNNTNIYYLTFKNPERFENIHRGFAGSGIKFDPNPYPYKPHCTLKLRKEPTDQELLELFFLNAPEERFIMDTLSLYLLHDLQNCELLHKVELRAD